MQHYASLSASYLRTLADKFNEMMKSGDVHVLVQEMFKQPIDETLHISYNRSMRGFFYIPKYNEQIKYIIFIGVLNV